MIVRPISATLTVDKDTFTNQDPYCILKMNGQKHQTSTCRGGGKTPVWNDTFTFNSLGKLNIEVWDDDPGLDDKIGEGDYDLTSVNLMNGQQTVTVPLLKGIFRSNVGFVTLTVQSANQGMGMGGGQWGGGGQGQWGGGGQGQWGGQQGGWGGNQGGQGWGGNQGGYGPPPNQGGWGGNQGGQGGWGGNQGGQGGWGGNQGGGGGWNNGW